MIEDKRDGNHLFTIKRHSCSSDNIAFAMCRDGKETEQNFARFEQDEVSSVFRYADNSVVPLPNGIAHLFCGLPLIGTEDIGLPFIMNSFKFEPTTERESVELEPTSNETNRKLFLDSIELYKKMLDYVEQRKMKKAYCLTKLTRNYSGNQASNTQFYTRFLPEYKKQILSHKIVFNVLGEPIPFSTMRLPIHNSKVDMPLYEYSLFVDGKCLPAEDDYESWFNATDFKVFTEQTYNYKALADSVAGKRNINSFGKLAVEVIPWLIDCCKFLKSCDSHIFQDKALIPNQDGVLCLSPKLYADKGLPQELKQIYNELYASQDKHIEDVLLYCQFNSLEICSIEYSFEMLSGEIDKCIKETYKQKDGNASSIHSVINRLYTWISKEDNAKSDWSEKLASSFPWFYSKRASLIVDMLNDAQREQALVIAQSGKMEALAKLVQADLQPEDYDCLLSNIKQLPYLIGLLNQQIDDSAYADSAEGDMGEEIVWKDLRVKYPASKGYKVVWASKEDNEPCYDFRVEHKNQVVCYCDAKTTKRGVANADSIPFFMRKSQWTFLQTLDSNTPYYIARVFMGDKGTIKYLRISKEA